MTAPIPPLPPLPDLNSRVWKLILEWEEAEGFSAAEIAKALDDEIQSMLRAYATAHGEAVAAALAPKWLPISEAPKDGTEVLGWREDCGAMIIRYTSCSVFFTERECDEAEEDLLFQEDWFSDGLRGGHRLEGSELPTHWMPLPTPTKGETP